MFLFGAEHCSPSDVLIGLPWGPCPSPPAGENHPPPPRGRITAVEGQPASLGCTSACPPRASHQLLSVPQRSQHWPGTVLLQPAHSLLYVLIDFPQTPVCIKHYSFHTPLYNIYDSQALGQYLWYKPVLLGACHCPLTQVTTPHFQTCDTVPLESLAPVVLTFPQFFLSLCVSTKQPFPFLPFCRDSPLSFLGGLTGLPSPQPIVITPTLEVLSVRKLS